MNSALFCTVLLCVGIVSGVPLTYPLKVAYVDTQIDCCAPEKTILNMVAGGYNVIVLAFYQTATGPADAAISWSQRMTDATQIATMAKVHAAGAVVLISLGGSNDQGWEKYTDAHALGVKIATWATQYHLDGVDFDLEHFGGFASINGSDQATINWFTQLTLGARSILGEEGVISFAPLAPWFGPIGMVKCATVGEKNCSWVGPSGGMTGVYKSIGKEINFFFVQFYNQGTCYTTEGGLFMESGPSCTIANAYYPHTSVNEIHVDGDIPLNKIVIGKPVDTRLAASGYVDPTALNAWIKTSGKNIGWNTGAGIWEWIDVVGSEAIPWLHAVYP